MILLAIDTCDSRGSVALLRDGEVLGWAKHESAEDYSSWLLPAVESVLKQSRCEMRDVDAYGVAAGPGSFTGVRVGLTTVKAWGEVYAKPIAAVSRLEAIAAESVAGTKYVAAFADARRGQVFGAVFRRSEGALERIGDEMVIAPGKFVQTAGELACGGKIAWASPDAGCVLDTDEWRAREEKGERLQVVSAFLGIGIARIAQYLIQAGRATDSLALDANYVRRSDAEIFWKGGAGRGS